MFTNITNNNKKIYSITKPGNYIFYFENKSGKIVFEIKCKNANIEIYGLYTGQNEENFNLNIEQIHLYPSSMSSCTIKSVLKQKSTLHITSKIIINEKAKKTRAHFVNKNLLLNNNAKTIISPQLEVVPADVKCSHASITSPLNQKELDYLIARGINLQKAKQLLIDGFVEEIKKFKQ